MAYLKNYQNSSLLKNEFLCNFMDGILELEPGQACDRLFTLEQDAKSIRNKLYTLLNGRQMKNDFVVSLVPGKLFFTLRVIRVTGGIVKSVEYYIKKNQERNI